MERGKRVRLLYKGIDTAVLISRIAKERKGEYAYNKIRLKDFLNDWVGERVTVVIIKGEKTLEDLKDALEVIEK